MQSLNHSLGIDIGGTKIAIGVVTSDGHVLANRTLATESSQGTQNAIKRICATIQLVLQDSGLEISQMVGAGIGSGESAAWHYQQPLHPAWLGGLEYCRFALERTGIAGVVGK
ncbi:MAG: ROK family protein [Verrucomicrobiae bacterium]|nr:ROK family protein [Verrucomicrobiae bacterium]